MCCARQSRAASSGAGLHRAPLASVAGRSALDQLEGVGGHADEPAGGTRGMAAAAGPLEQPGDPLGAADLKHLIHRAEVDAQVEARRGHDALHLPPLQPLLGGRAQLAVDRAVMEGQAVLPRRPRLADRVKPPLGLRAGVGEHERRLGPVECREHLGQEPHPHVAGPGKAFHRLGDQGLDLELPRDRGRDEPGLASRGGPDQGGGRLGEVGERGREAPGDEPGPQGTQTGEGEFGLHAPLRREQLVPLVHDHGVEVSEDLVSRLQGEENRERFGRGDQRRWPVVAEPAAVGLRRVAGADADGDARRQRPQGLERLLERGGRIGGEGAERRDPDQPQAAGCGRRDGRGFVARGHQPGHRAQPGGQGLARAGRGVKEPALAGRHRPPDLRLEIERRPAAVGKPGPKPLARGVGATGRPGRPSAGCTRGRRHGVSLAVGAGFGRRTGLAAPWKTPSINGKWLGWEP